jgi:hypothetical protein
MPATYEYAERFYPEKMSLQISQPDRAVASVMHGTRSYLEGDVKLEPIPKDLKSHQARGKTRRRSLYYRGL